MHHCPFAHDELPLPEPARIFLEDNLIRMFSQEPPGASASEEAEFYQPVLQAFQPWISQIREALGQNPDAVIRTAHDTVSYIGEILNTSGLTDHIHTLHHQLEDEQALVTDPHLSISQRARKSLALDRKKAVLVEGIRRGLIRVLFRSLPRYLEDLTAAAMLYRKSSQSMRNAFGMSSGLWDLEPGVWQRFPSDTLEDAAAMLSLHPSIQELTDSLGRRAVESLPPQKHPPDILHEPETALGKSELVGITQGSSLEDLLPRELSFLANPATGGLFVRDYAEQRLVMYEYKTRIPPKNPPRQVFGVDNREQRLGPFILCIDTSGSMAGQPEQVAKALSLAVLRRAINKGRRVCLVSFSDVATARLIQPRGEGGKPQGLEDYLEFLQHSFRGGTDLRPALEEAITTIRTKGWQGADLLIVSDFRVPKIMIKKSGKLRAVQEEFGTRVHALSIGQFPIEDSYNLFDSRWLFRITRHGAAQGIEETS